MELAYGFEDMETVREINFVGMLLQQILHHQMMRRATDYTDVVMIGKGDNFFVVADKFSCLAGITKTGQAVCGNARLSIFYYGNNSRHG